MITAEERNLLIDLMMETAARSLEVFSERFNALAIAGTPRFTTIEAASGNRSAALEAAVDHAIKGNFYMALIGDMDRRSLPSPKLRSRIPEGLAQKLAEFEQHAVFDDSGMWDIQWSDAVARVAPSIGVIRIPALDNPYVGTGVLVGPRLLLTAAHVVKSLVDFETVPPRAIDGLSNRVQVEFHHPRVVDRDLNPVVSKFDVDWLKSCSPPCGSPPRLNGLDEELAKTNLDFALILLATPVGRLIRPISINAPPAANDNHMIAVAGHLGGTSLKFHVGKLIKVHKPTKRLHHTANASHGMSGGPCVDIDGMMIGIHEGATATYNRSVYLRDIREKIAAVAPDPLLADSDYVAWLPRHLSADALNAIGISQEEADRHPIVGRRAFQDWIRSASSSTNSRRMALISGEPASGKSLSGAILNAYSEARGDLLVLIPPEVARLARIPALLERMAEVAIGTASRSDFAPVRPDAGLLRHDIIPGGLDKLFDSLQQMYGNKPTPIFWLSIDFGSDLGWASSDQDTWKSFFGEVLKRNWLRLAIAGISEGRQAEFRALFSQASDIYCETLASIGWPEIEEFVSETIGTGIPSEEKAALLGRLRRGWERRTAGLGPLDRMRVSIDILLFLLLKTALES
jgi:hypothetical protein